MDYETTLEKILTKLFPDTGTRSKVRGMLSWYGNAEWQKEPGRVRLAILKLAGVDLEMIQYFTVQACRDYRDVLAMAEYPNAMANPYLMKNDPEAARELEEEDQRQYKEWYLTILWDMRE